MHVVPALWNTHVRSYECDRYRHVNNAVYIEYITEATLDAWSGIADADWRMKKLSAEYRAPAVRGDRLLVSGWPMGNAGEEGASIRCGYAIRKNNEAEPIARAEVVWRLYDRTLGMVVTLPEPWPVLERRESDLLRPDRNGRDPVDGRWYRYSHTIGSHEVGGGGTVDAAQILRCVEDARVCACADAGWENSRLAAENFLSVQIRHEAEFLHDLCLGDRIVVRSRVCDLGRLRGTWEHRFERDGELVARDFSTGAFLNRDGRLAKPPEKLMEDLVAN